MRLTLRSLARSPGFTATALATLALCLGANLAIFAVVDAILVRPLPFPRADRLVSLVNAYPGAGVQRSASSVVNYFERRGALEAFSSLSLFRDEAVIVGDAGAPSRVPIARITPEFFSTLGVPLVLGRVFSEAELAHGPDQVAILTDAFWHKHFQGDPHVVGRTFLNDNLPITVIGVLPPGFRFLSSHAQFFRPHAHTPEERQPDYRHNNNSLMIGRLAPDRTLAEAEAQLAVLNTALEPTDPAAAQNRRAGFRTNVFSLHADHVREVRPTLVLLQCGVLFLLLIGSVNLANLFLVRASARGRELAVRQALGARGWHIARQALAESLMVAFAGGMLGLLLGAFGVELLATLGTDQLPLGATIELNARVATVSLAGTFVVGLALAAPVIWFNLRRKLASSIQSESRSGTASPAAQRLRNAFIVAQISLAFVLVSGAALLALSLERVLSTPAGFRADNVLTGRLMLPWKSYPDDPSRLAFVERLIPAMQALPGLTHAAVVYDPPFTEGGASGATAIEGYTLGPNEAVNPHYLTAASADYWPALGIPLLRGRLLEDADNHRPQRVCVVDEALANRYWPGADPIGRRLSLGFNFNESQAATIVGVVGNVKQNELAEASGYGTVYFPYALFNASSFSLVVRTTLPPAALAPAIRSTILELDPGLPIDDMRSMQARIDDSLATRRSPAILAGVFAGVALLLAAIGTYGVLAYVVSQRRREIGVRMALGALPRQILAQFLRLGATLLLIGLVLGTAGAWLAGRLMQSQLFGVGAMHAGVIATSAGVMLVVVLLATLGPSRRAAQVNPIEALRSE